VSRVTTRRAIVLVLVAAGLLLAVPGGAAAHVKAKYKAEYRAKLAYWESSFDTYDSGYAAARDQSNALAATMAPLIGDPDKHAQLVAYELYALNVCTSTKSLPDTWWEQIDNAMDADLRKARRWFAAAKDRKSFKAQALRVRMSFTGLMSAHRSVNRSFEALSTDPPELEEQAREIARSDESVSLLRSFFARAVAALRKLL